MGRPVDIQFALKPLKKIRKMWDKDVWPFSDQLNRLKWWTGPARPGPTRPDRNALWRLISQKVWKIWIWKFNTISIQLSNLCYYNLELISLSVWKLWAFPQGSNFVNFQQFFHHNFRLKYNFLILIVASLRSSRFIKINLIIYQKNIFLSMKINF